MKAPKINLKELKRHKKWNEAQREDFHQLVAINEARMERNPEICAARIIRTANIFVIVETGGMTFDDAMKAYSKIVDNMVKLAFESIDIKELKKKIERARQTREELERSGIVEVLEDVTRLS